MQFAEWQKQIIQQSLGISYYVSIIVASVIAYLYISQRLPHSSKKTIALRFAIALFFCLSLLFESRAFGILILMAIGFYIFKHWKAPLLAIPNYLQLCLLASIIRLPMMFESFWYDETFTANLASRPFLDMLTVIRYDVHPPLWYILEWLMLRIFGQSEFSLRLLSYLASIATVYLIYRLSLSLKLSSKTAYVSGLLFALMPAHIAYSANARPYALLVFFVILSLVAIVEYKPRLLAVALLPIPLLHNIAYLWLASLSLAYLFSWYMQPKRKWSHLLAYIPVYVAALTWMPILLLQTQDISDGFWLIFHPSKITEFFLYMTIWARLPESLLLQLYAAMITLIVLALYHSRQWLKTKEGIILAWLMFSSLIVAWLISWLWKPVLLDRALMSTTALLCIPIAYLIMDAPYKGDKSLARILLIPTLALSLISMTGVFGEMQAERPPLGAYIANACRDSDYIFVSSTAISMIVHYYNDNHVVLLWSEANDISQTLPDIAKDALGWQRVETLLPGRACWVFSQHQLTSTEEAQFLNDNLAKYKRLHDKIYTRDYLSLFRIIVLDVTQ